MLAFEPCRIRRESTFGRAASVVLDAAQVVLVGDSRRIQRVAPLPSRSARCTPRIGRQRRAAALLKSMAEGHRQRNALRRPPDRPAKLDRMSLLVRRPVEVQDVRPVGAVARKGPGRLLGNGGLAVVPVSVLVRDDCCRSRTRAGRRLRPRRWRRTTRRITSPAAHGGAHQGQVPMQSPKVDPRDHHVRAWSGSRFGAAILDRLSGCIRQNPRYRWYEL